MSDCVETQDSPAVLESKEQSTSFMSKSAAIENAYDSNPVSNGFHSGEGLSSKGKSEESATLSDAVQDVVEKLEKLGRFVEAVDRKISNLETTRHGDMSCQLSAALPLARLRALESASAAEPEIVDGVNYVQYSSEEQMPLIVNLITKDLSEPYTIYTYRYFIHNWPKLCFLAMSDDQCVGAIVCKLDLHKQAVHRGYIAMLAVEGAFRRKKIATKLVNKAILAMIRDGCDEVVLETEITNKAALKLYENLGFVRDKRLYRYYLNGVDAFRLKLWLR